MSTNSVNRLTIYITLLVSSFFIYFCLNESSLAIECLLLFLILLVSKLSNRSMKFIAPIALVTLFFLISLTISGRLMERGDYNIPWKFAVKFIHLLFALMAGYAISSLSKGEKRKIIIAAIVSLVISAIVSLYYVVFVHSEAIRFGSAVGITRTFSFDQMYGVVVLAPALLMFYMKSRTLLRRRLIFLGAIVIIFACILFSALTTAILLAAMGVALIYAFDALEKRNRKKILLWVVFILGLLIMMLFRRQIGEWLFKLTYNLSDYIKYRLQRVIDILFATEHANAYTMDRRFELANYSIDTFKRHPLFGVGIGGIRYGVVGYHQEWPDVLAVCGIIGTVIIIIAMIYSTRVIYKNCENTIDKRCMLMGIILFLTLGFLNPCMVAPELFAIYVILPNISSLLPDHFLIDQ